MTNEERREQYTDSGGRACNRPGFLFQTFRISDIHPTRARLTYDLALVYEA